MKRLLLLPILAVSTLTALGAEVKTEPVTYEHDGAKLSGFLARPADDAPHPGVLVIHEWWGLNDYAKERARQLAELGFVAFACDMYGDGKVTDDPKQAGEWAKAISTDKTKLRARAAAGLEQLKKAPGVDAERLAAIGYCFGGTTVLELAASGADLRGVVSFHGNPNVPSAEEAGKIKASVLICHGDADPMVSDETLQKVTAALSEAKVDWLLIRYADAKHAFTNPDADKYEMPPVGYNAKADQRSWEHMRTFFAEVLPPAAP